MNKQYNLAVFIGRFSPFHNGHLSIVLNSLNYAENLTILIGSCFQSRSYFNPFDYSERKEMIERTIRTTNPDLLNKIHIQPLRDYIYNDGQWVTQVQNEVKNSLVHFKLPDTANIALAGHNKDGTSYYLKMFPQWKSMGFPNYDSISSTSVRENYFSDMELNSKIISTPTQEFLLNFKNTPAYMNILDEYDFIKDFKKPYENLPYGIIFQTVDACVIQSGHILLIKRRAMPGKGLWALPGGYVNNMERIEDAVYRELREETKIKVPEPVLRGSTVMQRTFDHPHRSARGRIITNAFLINLSNSTEFAKVKGSDDADKAKWWPLSEIRSEMMFEDHFHIINYFERQL
jgi:bifunctional NMN adenylyltransferase/nudix hydrolase